MRKLFEGFEILFEKQGKEIQGILLSKEIRQHFLSAIKYFKYPTFSGIEALRYQTNRSTKKPKHDMADLEMRYVLVTCLHES